MRGPMGGLQEMTSYIILSLESGQSEVENESCICGLGNMGASLAKAVIRKWTRKTCSWSIVLLKG